MAKEKFDFDSDLDFDLDKELSGIDFGETESKPPKNKREAVERTVKSVGKGFRDEILDNKLKTAGKLAQNSIPRALSAEMSDITNVMSDVKNIVEESVDEVKKQGAGLSRALGKLMPENSKLANLLNKIGDKLHEPSEASSKESKEQQQEQEIQQGILAAIGEMKDKSHTDAMLQQTMQNKQFASNIEMLKNIYAETKLNRLFNYEITNAYYRKSLELQYKQLFTQREILEIQKLAYTTQKNQLETIVLNTALPDFIKARSSEIMKYTVIQKGRDLIAGNLYKSGGAFDRFGKNITRRVKGFMSGLKEGLGASKDMVDMFSDISTMYKDMGMNLGEMAGSSIANFMNQYLGGKIGKLIEKTSWGKEGIFRLKEAYADPRKFLKGIAYQNDPKGAQKLFSRLAKFGLGFTSNQERNTTEYFQKDLDESALFDNRAHQSITKVIPGLLGKIFGEVKLLRTGLKIQGDTSQHELVFDNRDDTFKTRAKRTQDLHKHVRHQLNNNFKGAAKQLHYSLSEMDVLLSGPEALTLNKALLKYSMYTGSSASASTLYDPEFLKYIDDPKLVKKLEENAGKIRAYLVEHPDGQEWVSNTLQSIKNSLPHMDKTFQDWQKSGATEDLIRLGVAKRDKYGRLVSVTKGEDKLIYKNYIDNTLGNTYIPEHLIGKSSSIVGQQVGNKIDSSLSGIVNSVSNITADDVISGGINAAHKAAGYTRQGMNTVDGLVQQATGTQAYKQAAQHAANLKAKFDNSRAGKLSNALLKAGQRNARKLKDKIANSKFVKSVMESNSAQKITEMFVEKKRKAEEFLNLPPEQQTAQAVKAFRDTQQAAREFINATKTAVTGDTDFKNLEHDIKEGMADIASMAKKVWNGEASAEDVQNFKNAMKIRAQSLGKTGKSLSKRGYSATKTTGIKLYTKAKVKAAEVKTLIQTNVNEFLQTDKGQKVLEKFRQAKAKYGTIHDKVGNKLGPVRTAVKNALGKAVNATTQEVDNLIDELDRVDRGEATTGSSKVLSAYDKVKSAMSTVKDTVTDPKKAWEAATKGYDKLKKFFEKPIDRKEAIKLHAKYIADRRKEGLSDDEILTDFMEWCKAFHIKIKGEGPFGGGIRGFFQWTRQKDREIWTKFMGGAIKAPFKFVGGMLSNTRIGNTIGKIPGLGKLTGLSGGGSLAAGSGNLAAKAGGLAMSAGIGLGKVATDMLPAPMRVLVQAPFMAIGTMATGMGEILKFMGIRTKQEDKEKKKQEKLNKKKEKTEKEKSSSDGWMSRLKQWGSRKKEEGKGLLEKTKNWFKEKKTPLTIMGGILGIFALTKTLGITVSDIAKGVTSVVKTVANVGKTIFDFGKGIYDFFGGGFSGLLAVLGAGLGVKKLAGLAIAGLAKLGLKAVKGLGGLAWKGVTLAGTSIYNKITGKTPTPKVSIDSKGRAITHYGKFAKATPSKGKVPKAPSAPGGKLPKGNGANFFSKLMTRLKDFGSFALRPVIWALEKAKDVIIKVTNKIEAMWGTVKSKFKFLTKALKKPKVAKKVGVKVASKVATRVAALAASATGIGVILSVGFAVWDIAWICKYMFLDDKPFWSAVSLQMIGIDLYDKQTQKELDVDEDKIAQEAEDNANKETTEDTGEEKGGLLQSINNGFNNVKDKVTGTFDNVTGTHNKQIIDILSNSFSVQQEIRDLLKGGSTKIEIPNNLPNTPTTPVNNATFASSQITNKDIALPTSDSNIKGNNIAAKAADLVTAKVNTENPTNDTKLGTCATFVNDGLRKAGINIGYGDGWKADSNLTKLGWQRVWDGGDGSKFADFKPQKGDVLSIGKPTGKAYNYKGKIMPEVLPEETGAKGGRVYGHTAIYNGTQWVSDFKQPYASPYSKGRTESYKYASVLRMPSTQELGGDISEYDRAKYTNRSKSLTTSVASKTSTSGNTRSIVNIDTSSVTDVLKESYKVHVESRELLKEIRDAVKASKSTTTQVNQQQPVNNVMPESAIRLQHNNYNFG